MYATGSLIVSGLLTARIGALDVRGTESMLELLEEDGDLLTDGELNVGVGRLDAGELESRCV